VLDGGHLLFIVIEKFKGSPVSLKARLVAQQVGVIALLTLIVFITYNDILRVAGIQ
jgi:regulator of sigma E protease